MRLPPATFASALTEAEARAPFLRDEAEFLKACREECARRGWTQADIDDPESWTFHEVAGFDSTSVSGPHRG